MDLPYDAITSLTFLNTIESVIAEVQPYFLEEGVEDVLSQLRIIWIKKLNQATFGNEEPKIPVKVTMPDTSIVMLSVPESSLEENKLQTILSNPVTSAIINFAGNVRSPVLQNYVHKTLNDVRPTVKRTSEGRVQPKTVLTLEGESTSSSGDDNSSASASNADTEENEDEESLNSNDDLTDEEKFNTENIVLCQYSKILRHKNKWKFQFSNGVMNLDGKDYVFNTLRGDAVW